MSTETLTLRHATALDGAAIARLVELEEADGLTGAALVAELDGTILAAISLTDGRVVADIFKPTADLARMLGDRRRQLLATHATEARPRRLGRVLARYRPVAAHA
jgi:hypothetical protein